MQIEKLIDMYKAAAYQDVIGAAGLAIKNGSALERHFRLSALSNLRLGQYSQAQIHLDQAVRLEPQKAVVNPWLPIEILDFAVSNSSNFHWAKYHLAVAYFERRQFMPARTLLEAFDAANGIAPPLKAAAIELLCEIIRRTEMKIDAIGALKKLTERYDRPGFESIDIYRGLTAYAENDLNAAEAIFARVAEDRRSGVHDRIKASIGAATFGRDLRDASRASQLCEQNLASLKDFELFERRKSDRFVVLCSADARYFTLFAEVYVASVLTKSGDSPIHFHIVNPTAECFSLIATLRAQIGWARFSVSTQQFDHPTPRPFYATARFLVAPRILKAYQLPLLITDIDAVFIADPTKGVKQLRTADIALKFNPSAHLEYPWTKIFATYSYFSARPAAFASLLRIGAFFWDRFDPTGASNNWWIDQNALTAESHFAPAYGARLVDIAKSKLNGIIEVNQAMEDKMQFIKRVRQRYPLSALQKKPD